MKHIIKRALTLVLALSVVCAMSITAFAAPAKTSISTASDDTHTYAVYQILTGELANGKISNAKWGKNGVTKTGDVPKETMDALAAITGTDKAKADALKAYVDLNSEVFGTVDKANALTDVDTGYYLIKDLGVKDGNSYVLPEGESYSLFIVQVAGPITIEAKRDTTSTEKKVDDVNDSNADENETIWQDSADYDIGDSVPFQLSANITEKYGDYDSYYFAFHDKESNGLKFNNDVVVKVDGNKITSGYEVVTTGLTDGCTFEIKFADLKEISAVHAGSVITAEYSSTLTKDAEIGSKGNPNEMYGEYTNNPNNEGEGTSKTPKDTVIVFTYELDGTKYFDEAKAENVLAGAGFTLFKYDADKEGTDKWVQIGNQIESDKDGKLAWPGLDDGKYMLKETKTPAGFNTMDPIEFTVTAAHSTESDAPVLEELVVDPTDSFHVVMTEAEEPAPTGYITTDLINKSGSVLPSTGGIGTTIFYVLGAILVLGAAILLITRRRVNAAK